MSHGQRTHITKNNKALFFLTLLAGTIGTDQFSKFLAETLFEGSDEMSFFYNFVEFSLVENHGGFLGIAAGLPENIRFFLLNICVFFLLLGCLVYLFFQKERTSRYDIPLLFVTGGGLSNLLDRLLHNGGVIDFVSIGLGSLRTGIFNLADVYILFGSFLLGYALFSTPATKNQKPTSYS